MTQPTDNDLITETPEDRRALLLEEARGEAPEPEVTEGEEETPPPDPLDLLRADMEAKIGALRNNLIKERERRRKHARRADALERQVAELAVRPVPGPAPVERVPLEVDEEGRPLLSREALERLQANLHRAPAPPAQPQNRGASDAAREAYERMRDQLVDGDPSYGPVFQRLEALTREALTGLQEAIADGETSAAPDDIADYLDESDLGQSLRTKYPEITDWELFVRAIGSNRAARKLAEAVHTAGGGRPPKGTRPPQAPPPTPDLTNSVRDRIREKANQTARTRSNGTPTARSVTLEKAAQMSAEDLLALPKTERDRLMRESLKGI